VSEKLIVLVASSSDRDWPDSTVYATLPLDVSKLQHLKQHIECFKAAREAYPGLWESYVFDAQVEWYCFGSIESDGCDSLHDQTSLEHMECDDDDLLFSDPAENAVALLPADRFPGYASFRTECDQVVVQSGAVQPDAVALKFMAYAKHTDVELTTALLSAVQIDEWLAELSPGSPHGAR
jgi:hypothetical protein